jgi:hypothetical protein
LIPGWSDRRVLLYSAALITVLIALRVWFEIEFVWTTLVPVALCLVPLIAQPHQRYAAVVVATLGVSVYALLAFLSIGRFYVPAIVALMLYLVWPKRRTSA